MKKLSLFIIILSLLALPAGNAFAQEEMVLPACSEEELSTTLAGITEVNEGFAEVATTFDLSSDPTDITYSETLVVLEAAASSYWTEFFVEVPACAEAAGIAYIVGAFYEDYLTTGLLLNAAAWAEAAGETEAAAEIAEQAAVRLEEIQAAAEAMSAMTFEELAAELFADTLPACTPEQLTEGEAAFETAYEGLAALEEETADSALAQFAITEGAAYTYDAEVHPNLSLCSELDYTADLVSIILNIANTSTGLYANAELEAAAGNTEVAEAMQAAGEAREELVNAMIEMMDAE